MNAFLSILISLLILEATTVLATTNAVGENVPIHLISLLHGHVLTSTDGVSVYLTDQVSDTPDQLWKFESTGCLRHEATNLCLEALSSKLGLKVMLTSQDSEQELQQWKLDASGHLTISNLHNLHLAPGDDARQDGVDVVLTEAKSSLASKWMISEDGQIHDENILERVSLDQYSQAITNDGQPGVYYLQTKTTHSKKALIYLKGGGYCIPNYPGEGCAIRCEHEPLHCSPKNETFMDIREDKMYSTIWNPDPDVNPAFHDFNKVYVPYSSSDLYSGTSDASDETENLYFHGKFIFEAVMQSLASKEGSWIADAEQIVMLGSSAGAFGVELNCDTFAEIVTDINQNVDVRCISDSGSLYPVTVHTEGCDPTEHFASADRLWKAKGDDTCMSEATTSEECFLMNSAYRYISTKMMILMSAEDTTIRNCWKNEPDFRLAWRTELSAIAQLIVEERPDIGVYISNCPCHTQNHNPASWNDMQIPVLNGEAGETVLLKDILYNFVNDVGPIHAIDNMETCNENCSHMNLCG